MTNYLHDNIKRRGLMFVISAPSGTGKTTLAKLLMKHDQHLRLCTSFTTRAKRPGEVDGQDYTFITKEKFNKMIEEDQFMEYVEIFGHFYGTPKSFVNKMLSSGEDALFDVDWQGHKKLTATARDDVTSVFILPPSKTILYNRLISRHANDKELVKARQARADDEISHWHEYDYVIINKDIDEALSKLIAILKAERLRKNRRTGLPSFVKDLMAEKIENIDI